jgi:hypothetical protein
LGKICGTFVGKCIESIDLRRDFLRKVAWIKIKIIG